MLTSKFVPPHCQFRFSFWQKLQRSNLYDVIHFKIFNPRRDFERNRFDEKDN